MKEKVLICTSGSSMVVLFHLPENIARNTGEIAASWHAEAATSCLSSPTQNTTWWGQTGPAVLPAVAAVFPWPRSGSMSRQAAPSPSLTEASTVSRHGTAAKLRTGVTLESWLNTLRVGVLWGVLIFGRRGAASQVQPHFLVLWPWQSVISRTTHSLSRCSIVSARTTTTVILMSSLKTNKTRFTQCVFRSPWRILTLENHKSKQFDAEQQWCWFIATHGHSKTAFRLFQLTVVTWAYIFTSGLRLSSVS